MKLYTFVCYFSSLNFIRIYTFCRHCIKHFTFENRNIPGGYSHSVKHDYHLDYSETLCVCSHMFVCSFGVSTESTAGNNMIQIDTAFTLSCFVYALYTLPTSRPQFILTAIPYRHPHTHTHLTRKSEHNT